MSDDTRTDGCADEKGIRIGFLELAPGISRLNFFVFCYSAFATIGFLTFVSTGTALVLNANFGMAPSEQGTVSGDLVIITEVVQILMFGIVGVTADRIGRREVAAIGIFLMGFSYVLYPFAESVQELFVYRAIYAAGLGASTGMLQTLLADYPSDSCRGKFVAVTGTFSGVGVIIVTLLFGRNVPPMLMEAGFDAITASRIVHILVALVCMLSAVLYWTGLKKGTPGAAKERPPIRELVVGGLTEARNPRIALSYSCAFIARSDQVVLGTFTVLWGTIAGVAQGLDPVVATSRGASLFAISSAAALVWLSLLGVVMDRFNRVSTVIFCMTVSAISYCATVLVEDPLAPESIKFFVLLGVGQMSAFFGATTLISQEAPKLKRGTVMGMFNIWGAIGIFIASGLGGRLFDSVGPYAPFMLIGVISAVIALVAVFVRIFSPGYMPGRDTGAS